MNNSLHQNGMTIFEYNCSNNHSIGIVYYCVMFCYLQNHKKIQ